MTALEFIADTLAPDYLRAVDGDVAYTIVSPRAQLLSPWPDAVQYSHPQMWTASRMPNDDFLSAVAGRFYLVRCATLEDAREACRDNHEVIERVRLWFEFMKLNDPRQLLGNEWGNR